MKPGGSRCPRNLPVSIVLVVYLFSKEMSSILFKKFFSLDTATSALSEGPAFIINSLALKNARNLFSKEISS